MDSKQFFEIKERSRERRREHVAEHQPRINDTDRAQWVDNDEGLHRMWKSSRQAKRKFIQEHRHEIDQVIHNVVGGRRQASYLVYG
jgi:hypothetical protein